MIRRAPLLVAVLGLAAWAGHCSVHEEQPGAPFILDGAHADLSCSACHGDDPGESLPRNCAGCHELDRPQSHFPDECDGCHGQQVWDDQEYAHEEWALTGAHLETPCGECHAVAWEAEPSCLSCHGEDAPTGHMVHECVFCHNTDDWTHRHWEHDFYPLIGGHDDLTCVSCHTSVFFGQESQCEACHADEEPPDHPEGQCVECHNIFDWEDAVEPD